MNYFLISFFYVNSLPISIFLFLPYFISDFLHYLVHFYLAIQTNINTFFQTSEQIFLLLVQTIQFTEHSDLPITFEVIDIMGECLLLNRGNNCCFKHLVYPRQQHNPGTGRDLYFAGDHLEVSCWRHQNWQWKLMLGNWLLPNTSSNETSSARSQTYSCRNGTTGQAVTPWSFKCLA